MGCRQAEAGLLHQRSDRDFRYLALQRLSVVRAECRKDFQSKPTTPYGYYSSTHKALVMNISTGGGTLVHEIVHPFIEANFPNCPAWLNEGLGSLYEQCGEVDGHIHGYTNWRLPGIANLNQSRHCSQL
jgi:hypothetical protein